jgi:hypothetical protein
MSDRTPNIGGTTPRTERLQALVDSFDTAFDELDPEHNLRIVAWVEIGGDLDTAITYSRGFSLQESVGPVLNMASELVLRIEAP